MAHQDLNARQLRFALGVIEGKPAGRAYEDAGYKARGDNADVGASKLLRNPKVATYVEKQRAQLQQQTGITAERVLNELAKIAFSDMRTYATWGEHGVTLNDSTTLTPQQSAAVAEVTQTTTQHGGSIKFKLHDKRQALRDLGQHLGLFGDASDRDDGNFDEWLEQLKQAKEQYGDAE